MIGETFGHWTVLYELSDNDGNYEPSNCRWATRAEQAQNKSNTRRRAA